MACLCVCAGMIVADFTAYITQARGILELMGGVLDALLPLIAGLMAALGAKVAGGLLGGVAAAVAGAGLKFGREYLIGMALVSAALELCSGLYSRLKLARAAELMRSLSGLMVGAALVLVLGMITINGSLGVQVDEVGVRAAKYALDNMVPVVGGEIKDTVEVMAASCALVQSLLGTCGMLMLLLGVSAPALKLAAGYISYKICSSLTQTLGGGEQLGLMCEGFAKVLRTLLVCVLGAAAILIMLLGALCDAGADAIMFDTLFASGSIMSKKMWVATEGEPMRKLADAVRAHGALPMVHNCGQKIYFDVQIESMNPAAISFLYPPDDCSSFAECKQKYGDKTMLIGCVTPANAVIGTDEDWDKQCKDQIDAMAQGGGFMLATGCEYPASAPFERAYRMIEIAKNYGKSKD